MAGMIFSLFKSSLALTRTNHNNEYDATPISQVLLNTLKSKGSPWLPTSPDFSASVQLLCEPSAYFCFEKMSNDGKAKNYFCPPYMRAVYILCQHLPQPCQSPLVMGRLLQGRVISHYKLPWDIYFKVFLGNTTGSCFHIPHSLPLLPLWPRSNP